MTGEAVQDYRNSLAMIVLFAANHYCQKEQKKQSRARLNLQFNFSVRSFLTSEAAQNYRNASK
jgi:hypothetical protein